MTAEDGPICAADGTSPGSCWMLGHGCGEHSFLDGPGMTVNFFMHNVELFWI